MNDALFVYGSLTPRGRNECQLSRIRGSWQKAGSLGRIVQIHKGTDAGYPGMLEGRRLVRGWLFSSRSLASHWHRIDAFEGAGYRRALHLVYTKDRELSAYVYMLERPKFTTRVLGSQLRGLKASAKLFSLLQ